MMDERHCPPVEFALGRATPWLIYPNGNSIKSHRFCNILEPNKNCIKRIPQMRRKVCHGSYHGWLVLMALGSSGCCSLFNPISLETIYLPVLKLGDEDDFELTSCTLSLPPTDPNCHGSYHGWLVLMALGSSGCCSLFNPISLETIYLPVLKLGDEDDFELTSCTLSLPPTDPNCMALFFCSFPLIIYCKFGDTQWTRQFFDTEERCIDHAVAFSDGTLYACTGRSNTMTITRDTSSGCLSCTLLNVEHPECPPEAIETWLYSLESCGELFRVYLYFSGTVLVNCIEVFKLEYSSQIAWVKVEDLGGQVFFLNPSDNSGASCSADEQSGLEGDCIYFTYPEDKGLYVFDMKDDRISVYLPVLIYRCHGVILSGTFLCQTTGVTLDMNCRIVDMTKDNERTVIDDKKMMVKQSLKDMSKEEEKVETMHSLFFNLPKELQHFIPTHLTSVVDYMNFRAACKPLRSLAPPIRWRSPWLMSVKKGVGFFLDPECNSIYRMDIPELFGCTIRFSKDGWLLVSKGDVCMFFFDPFTKMRIEIPDMTEYYFFEGICFTSLPTSSDCVIFGFGSNCPDFVMIGWYRLGQENWSYSERDIIGQYAPFTVSRSNPVFYDGHFYFLSLEGRLGVFDGFNRRWTMQVSPLPCSSTSQTYLVECDGDLLSVFLDYGGNTTIISRFDHAMMDWVKVNSLSDKMLFLSPSTSMAIGVEIVSIKI